MDGEDYDIQSIVCKNGTSNPDSEAFTMWWWDTATKKYVYATYCNPYWVDDGTDDGAGTEVDEFGWATTDDDVFGYLSLGTKGATTDRAKTFVAGEGFWIMPASAVASPSVTVAGKVANVAASTATVAAEVESSNKQLIANPFPVGIDVQDIKCYADGKNPDSEAFTMWWWDTESKKYVYATYCNPYWVDDGTDDGAGTEVDEFGWATTDDDVFGYLPVGTRGATTDHEKTFDSGEGFWLMPASAVKNGTVTFPNPFYSAE